MALPRYNGHRDANEAELLKIFDDLRVPWRRVNHEGLPDLLCIIAGQVHAPEIKSKAGHLEPAQIKFREWLVRYHLRLDEYYPVLRTPAEVIEWVETRRRKLWRPGA